MSQHWYQKATVQGHLVTGVFAVIVAFIGAGAAVMGTWWRNAARERDQLKAKLDGWQFSESLYRVIPGDVDFIARGLRVDKGKGRGMHIVGPQPDDDFMVQLSTLRVDPKSTADHKKYQVGFTVLGTVGGSSMAPSPVGPVPVEAGQLFGPVSAGIYEFYLFVEKVEVDYVFLTVARRRLTGTSSWVMHAEVPFGRAIFRAGPPPAPILVKLPP